MTSLRKTIEDLSKIDLTHLPQIYCPEKEQGCEWSFVCPDDVILRAEMTLLALLHGCLRHPKRVAEVLGKDVEKVTEQTLNRLLGLQPFLPFRPSLTSPEDFRRAFVQIATDTNPMESFREALRSMGDEVAAALDDKLADPGDGEQRQAD